MDRGVRTTMLRHLVGQPARNGHVDEWTLERRLTELELLLVSLGYARPEQIWSDDEYEGRHERR